jgi:ATP-dependent Lhr-like helicase
MSRRTLDPRQADEIGALDPAAVQRVREEAWPQPESAEEVHEALLWMGYVAHDEAAPWRGWIDELAAAGRVVREGERWYAVEASRDPREVWRGRLQALGPVFSDDPVLAELEGEGFALRLRLEGRQAWCERRLLARIHRYTLETLRKQIEPVSSAVFLRFLSAWQHADEEHQLDGPRGVLEVVQQLAGFDAPAPAWERSLLPARVRGYRREWLDELALSGQIAWGRVWGGGASALRSTPICLLPRQDLASWLGLAGAADTAELSAHARDVYDALARRGAVFHQELEREAGLLPAHLEMGLGELIARGLVSGDSYAALRQMLSPLSRRRYRVMPAGRWSLFRDGERDRPSAEFVARALLRRTGVVFRRTALTERQPVPWSELVRVYRRLELRGEIRGGRFVAGVSGEQYALPAAVELLRRVRRDAMDRPALVVAAADPLNLEGIMTPGPRVSRSRRSEKVMVG